MWKELDQTEKKQIHLMLFSLKEFCHGFDRFMLAVNEFPEGHATIRFYMNSLYQYCFNYFITAGPDKLSIKMKRIGCGDLLDSIEELLSSPFDTMTFKELLRRFRNKFLTHQSFSLELIEREIFKKVNLRIPANKDLFENLIQDLFRKIKQLFFDLSDRFPQALEEREKFFG